jgi:uncharacterized membrane protein
MDKGHAATPSSRADRKLGSEMGKGRLEAFSDGVIAIIITIMVLQLQVPEQADWAALMSVGPMLASYVLSFVIVGIYWNNHHHLLHATSSVTGGILWANLHLLFWLSLIPFVTAWLGHHDRETAPTVAYGLVLLMCAVAWTILQAAILAHQRADSPLAQAVGRDWKGKLSLTLYAAAVPLALINTWLADAVFIGVALMWLVPDRRIESKLQLAAGQPAAPPELHHQ